MQLVRVRHLHDVAQVHDRDTAGDVFDDGEVVRDEQVRKAQLALQVFKHVDDLRLDGHVQRGNRLVADDELGVRGERAGDADALALTAGELVRVAGRLFAGDADRGQQLANALVALLLALAQLVHVNRLGDDIADRHARVQRGVRILEDHLRPAAVLLHGFLRDRLAVENDLAGGGLVQVQQRAANGRLAAAGLADKAQRLALLDGEGHVVHGLEHRGLEEAGGDREILLEVSDLNQRLVFAHHASPPSQALSRVPSRSIALMEPSSAAMILPCFCPSTTFIQQALR